MSWFSNLTWSVEEWKSAKWSMLSNQLNANTISDDLMFLLQSVVIWLQELGETELSWQEDLLSAWELELCSSQGFSGKLNVVWLNSTRHKDLTNIYSRGFTKGLTEGTSHTLLESICTSTWKHLIDSNHMPWMDSDSHVEMFLTTLNRHVLVTGNSGSFKSFRSDLFLFVANKMDAWWESVVLSLLFTYIVDSQFWVWYTTIEPRLWIWLILLISETPGWSSSHLFFDQKN